MNAATRWLMRALCGLHPEGHEPVEVVKRTHHSVGNFGVISTAYSTRCSRCGKALS